MPVPYNVHLFTEDDDEYPDVAREWEENGLRLAGMLRDHQRHPNEDQDHSDSLSIRAAFTNAQQLAERAAGPSVERSFEQLVPLPYREFHDVFDKTTSERIPD
ncbi:hypothetical protein EVG20_g11390 [Dentipellis fragilis]|uniref:Uncharacterized protein n=1 Tax=Dentipellis fragilis TaxID=205917 RepID=A0A4Y9XMT7_9AGAM|nr:hypothetical protein EVG20_g11390 [Dentipellis fragilis]